MRNHHRINGKELNQLVLSYLKDHHPCDMWSISKSIHVGIVDVIAEVGRLMRDGLIKWATEVPKSDWEDEKKRST